MKQIRNRDSVERFYCIQDLVYRHSLYHNCLLLL